MKYYRNSGNPPENRERNDSTKREAANPSLSPTVPDVLVRSIHNPAFVYEEIDAMKPSETRPNVQNQWQPPFNEMLNYYDNEVHKTETIDPALHDAPPAYPGRSNRSSSNPPPPVPKTRRPSAQSTPRMRSLTDVNAMPTLPLGLGRDISPNPPRLLPKARRPSEGNPSPPDGISSQQTAIYSNFPTSPISEAGEGPNGDNGENDDTDEDGYIQCIRSYPPPNDEDK